jgi:hypothetical protein
VPVRETGRRCRLVRSGQQRRAGTPEQLAVAGLDTANTVVLVTRERVHDLGVLKAVGMTPGQTITMVVTTVAATGLISVEDGVALQHAILSIMGNGARRPFPQRSTTSTARRSCWCWLGLVIAVVSARTGRLGGADPHRAHAARGVRSKE